MVGDDVRASVLGIADGPVHVEQMQSHPAAVYPYFAGGLALYVRQADIDRLSAALDQAREVLNGSASNGIKEESR